MICTKLEKSGKEDRIGSMRALSMVWRPNLKQAIRFYSFLFYYIQVYFPIDNQTFVALSIRYSGVQ
jgi:hypothetical protein